MIATLFVQLAVTIAALWTLRASQRDPPLWKFGAAVLAGNITVTLLGPLFFPVSLATAFRGWLVFGPLVAGFTIFIWLRLRWASRRQRGRG